MRKTRYWILNVPSVISTEAQRSGEISYYSLINNERCLQFGRHDKKRVPEQQLAVFNMARREHELRSTITFGAGRSGRSRRSFREWRI